MLKFSSKAISEHEEVPLADDGRLERIVTEWEARQEGAAVEGGATSYVVSLGASRDPVVRGAQLAEIVALVESQGGTVVGKECRYLATPNPKTLVGKGVAEELGVRARATGATMLVLDAELGPSQTRNLEDAAGIPICDREAIILNVFLRHARTRRARIQASIAQLEYLRPRIRGVGLDMDQQTGGTTQARGPGETASELMARKLDGRLVELRKALAKLAVVDGTQRRRRRQDCKRAVLVGYTNAGKTSLMNALTDAGLSARDMPFETLDTTSRSLSRHGGEFVLSDTVGFIRRLPERLLASFESTLAEIVEASLLVIVVDASDYERDLQLDTTTRLLERMGAADVPRLYVWNKTDRLDAAQCGAFDLASGGHPWVALSAHDPVAVRELHRRLLATLREEEGAMTAVVPYAARDVMSLVYRECRVVRSEATEGGLVLGIEGAAPVLERIRDLLASVTS